MAVIVAAPPVLSGNLSLFHTTDPLLANSPVLAFYGPAATVGATSSRMQIHIFTPAGHSSTPRLAISPNSPFYSAVSNLPREEQGDEDCRGLAFALKKYFHELPDEVKKTWCAEAKAPMPAALFGDEHVAILASRMTKIENVDEVIEDVASGFGEHRLSWLDVDVVLPSGVIRERPNRANSADWEEMTESQALVQQYGRYAELIDALGDVAFLPTSKLKRAPSKPTTLGRAASFLKQQKENVHKQFCELLETEANYVQRIEELSSLRLTLSQDLDATDTAKLQKMFPSNIEELASLNAQFLQALRSVFEASGEQALADIETSKIDHQDVRQTAQDLAADEQGVGALAKCMCDWFPRFSGAYSPYLQGHAKSAQALRDLLKDSDSAITAHIQAAGEQKLTSLLIEPVQRLPRYSLYIDTIIKQLPARHPAIKHLLKARDIVTEICDAGMSANDSSTAIDKLHSRVSGWPADFTTSSRLVTAVDVVELSPTSASEACDGTQGMLLLFTDVMVVLEKTGRNASNARALLTEIESGPAPLKIQKGRPGTPNDLCFVRQARLDHLECLEMQNGSTLKLMEMSERGTATRGSQQATVMTTQVLRLEGSYERKAERFVEDLVKARVEGRFSEPERESSKWEPRACQPAADSLSLFAAVFEDSNSNHVSSRDSMSPVRIIVDIDKHSYRPRAGQNGLRTVISLSPCRDGLWRVSVDSVDGTIAREHVTVSEVFSVVRRKLATLLCAKFSIEQPAMTACLLEQNALVLRSINLQALAEEDISESQVSHKERFVRPKSPKKLLSSFLSSTGPSGQPPSVLKKDLPPLPPPTRFSREPSSAQSSLKPSSRDGRPPSRDQLAVASTPSLRSTEQLVSPFRKLEDTLSTYLLALQARKGNIVGRSLKLRASAEQLAVNELYNGLLEDPNLLVLAAQTSVDVLFAAFEKFLNIAWKEQIGQVLPSALLQEIQMKAETLFPADFDEYFKTTLHTLPPQNQRAFKGIMKLLADLLDGTGNDGDRGILTAAFAEVLVTEGNPHDYIALIDRFVDDPDTYFGEPLEDMQKAGDSVFNPHKRARSVNSASISSNTSSLRKKFGFGSLSRENSKSEQESKVASVWRTLSKPSHRSDASPANSISRGSLYRSHSTDVDVRTVPSRPTSQGEPSSKVSTCAVDESIASGNSSVQNLGLSTIGEHPSFIPTQPPRKKRRSSLSDLKALGASQEAWMVPASRKPPMMQRYTDDKSLPASPMPSTPSSKGGSGRFGSPLKETPRSRLPASFRKETSPAASRTLESTDQRPKSSSSKLDEPKPISGIPTLHSKAWSAAKTSPPAPAARTGLAERPGAGNIVKKPSPTQESVTKSTQPPTENASPRKLRMQSPQKLRERLQNETSAVEAAHVTLQQELSKIGDELSSSNTPSRIGSVRITPSRNPANNIDLASRVLKLEGALPAKIDELTARIQNLHSDVTSSLTVSESKARKLDDLYREANGENEALYARFNDELGRLLKAVKAGEGVEEMRRKLKESQEEAAKLRRENGRLKRENLGLRAQLKE